MSKGLKLVGAVVAGVAAVIVGPFVPALGIGLMRLSNYLLVMSALDYASDLFVDTPHARTTGRDVEFQGTVEPGRIIYGKQKVSGMNVIPPWTSGSKNELLHQVLAIAAHRVESIESIYFGQEEITGIATVSGNSNDGKVTSGTYTDRAWVRGYVGTNSQTVDYILDQAFTQWTSNHKGLNIAYLALQFKLDEDVYQSGKPEVSCIVQGKRCYDPTMDTTPGDDPTNNAFRAYTTNPALCLADYLIDDERGIGEDPDRIDWDSVLLAQLVCDEDVDIPGATTQKRYTCNVVLPVATSEEQRRENIKTLTGAMMGACIFRGGKWRMHAGTAGTPSFALTADDIHPDGDFEIRTEQPTGEKYNNVPGQFVDRDRNYQLSPFETRSNSTYETDDGEVLPREVVFPACDNQYEAQRNAMVLLRRSRRKVQINGPFAMSAFQIRPWDVGTMTLEEIGWDEQRVRCMGWTFDQVGKCELTLLEELATDWDDPDVADYGAPDLGGSLGATDTTPDEVEGFSIVPGVDGFWVNVDLPANYLDRDRILVYGHTSASPFSSATLLVSGALSNRVWVPRATTSTVYIWLKVGRGSGANQVTSTRNPNDDGVPAYALSVSTGFRITATPQSHYKQIVDTASGTTAISTITPINQSAAPTYSTARISGDTSITVNGSTTATPSFSVSGLADLASVSATFRCTATSSGASPGTATVDIQVRFRRDDNLYL